MVFPKITIGKREEEVVITATYEELNMELYGYGNTVEEAIADLLDSRDKDLESQNGELE